MNEIKALVAVAVPIMISLVYIIYSINEMANAMEETQKQDWRKKYPDIWSRIKPK